MYDASLAHIDEISAELKAEYGQPASVRLGRISTLNSPHPMLRNWALSRGLMAMTFEALGGFSDDRYDNASFRAQKANAELIGNWLRNVLRTFAEAQP